MIDFLIFDEVDRTIELGLFDDLKSIFKFMMKDVLAEVQEDPDMERLKDRRDKVMFNGAELEVFDENEGKESQLLTSQEINYAKYCQCKRRTFLISATLTKISGTSRMIGNKKFKKFLKGKLKRKNQNAHELHPKIMDVMSKVSMKNDLEIIDMTKDEKCILPKNLQVLKVKCPADQKMYYLDYILREHAS